MMSVLIIEYFIKGKKFLYSEYIVPTNRYYRYYFWGLRNRRKQEMAMRYTSIGGGEPAESVKLSVSPINL